MFAVVTGASDRRTLAAIDAEQGEMLWTLELPEEALDPKSGWMGRTLVHDAVSQRVFAARDGASSDQIGAEAVDAETGELAWTRTMEGADSVAVMEVAYPPGAPGESYLVMIDREGSGFTSGSSTGKILRALRTSDGGTHWRHALPDPWLVNGWQSGSMVLSFDQSLVYGLYSSDNSLNEHVLVVVSRDVIDGSVRWIDHLPNEEFEPVPLTGITAPIDMVRTADGTALLVLAQAITLEERGYVLARVKPPVDPLAWGVLLDDDGEFFNVSGQLGRLFPDPSGQRVLVVRSLGSAGNLVRIDARSTDDGALLWRREIEGENGLTKIQAAALDPHGRTLAVAFGETFEGPVEVIGLDVESGVELWASCVSAGADANRLGSLLARGGDFIGLLGSELPLESSEATLVRFTPEALVAGPDTIALDVPESVSFLLDRPAASAGHSYWILGSASGTEPGVGFAGYTLSLVPDAYWSTTLLLANQGPFDQTLGVLDAAGDAQASICITGPLDPAFAGTTLHHAFAEFDDSGAIRFVSESVGLALVAR